MCACFVCYLQSQDMQGGGGLFGQQQQQAPSTGGAFSFALAPQQQQQQGQGQPLQYHVLITKDNKPVQHSTAWDDIHPEGQKYLLELECAHSCFILSLRTLITV